MISAVYYRLAQCSAINEDLVRVCLRPQNKSDILQYHAGQYVAIHLDHGSLSTEISPEITLNLSIANKPDETGLLEFHIRHDHNQPLAKAFLAWLNQNKVVKITGPYGKMRLDKTSATDQLILIAGGSGIAPFKALLENIIHFNSPPKNIKLIWGIRKQSDFYLQPFLDNVIKVCPTFHYDICLQPETNAAQWPALIGYPHERLQTVMNNVCGKKRFYLSGPYAMIQKCLIELQQIHRIEQELIVSDMLPTKEPID